MIQQRNPPRSLILALFLLVTILLIYTSSLRSETLSRLSHSSEKKITPEVLENVQETLEFMIGDPVPSSQFSELGRRLQTLREWIEIRDDASNGWNTKARKNLAEHIEKFALVDFPFIRDPKNLIDPAPLQTLRNSYIPGSRGIVIPTGKGTFRFACHLVGTLRQVLNSTLPIEIVYSGEDDLPHEYRAHLIGLDPDLTTVDITKSLDDTLLKLGQGGWAVKPFAALASKFEQVLVLDSDVVFTQAPEIILDSDAGFLSTGAKFYHDRLLWQGAFKERHEWWESELQGHNLSPAIRKSKVYNEGYAEEMDSGVVALDKSRLDIFLGLLHICWQNSAPIRDFTYKMGYGDKETWWFGLELSGAHYAFEEHYGAIAGYAKEEDGFQKVCSFTIAHLDANNTLLWYNGSLLKNKAVDKREFAVPSHHMVDGVWEKGGQKKDISCMREGAVREVRPETRRVVEASVELARRVDEGIQGLVEWD